MAHGQWEKWCREEVGMTPQHTNRFVKIYEELGTNRMSTFDLGVEALYQIATMPAEERDRNHVLPTGETKTVDEMTVRELREVKRALKESEARCKQLLEEAVKTPKVEYVRKFRSLYEFPYGVLGGVLGACIVYSVNNHRNT